MGLTLNTCCICGENEHEDDCRICEGCEEGVCIWCYKKLTEFQEFKYEEGYGLLVDCPSCKEDEDNKVEKESILSLIEGIKTYLTTASAGTDENEKRLELLKSLEVIKKKIKSM
jgi:hypothetical protein